jgi:hypothetical protein
MEKLGGAFFVFLNRPENILRFERQVENSDADGVGEGVADGGRCRR